VPDRSSRPGDPPAYELPSAYRGTASPGPDSYADAHVDVELDDEASVRALHRDDDVRTPSTADAEPGVIIGAVPATVVELDEEPPPRTRQEFVERRGRADGSSRSTRRTWAWRGLGIAVVVLMIPVLYSYVNHLRRPGTDSLAVKSVEWFRDHGGNGFVNTIERWWYTNNPPPTGGRPDRIEVQGTSGSVDGSDDEQPSAPTATTAPVQPEHLPPPTGRVPTPAPVVEANEGVWMPVGRQVGGMPAEYITFVRPDAAHTAYYTALMWLDTKLLRAVYVPGLNEPGGGPNPWGSQIPEDQRAAAIAAFNSGFKMDQARGGAYFGGQEVRGLVGGAASLVIFKDGTASVGVWGRDFNMSPDVEAVRQNLELLVDNGQLNPELREDDTQAFGATLGNNVYVWRSGVGVDRNGGLIYAGGPAMSVVSLAKTLQNAGAVRAMELDINTDWVSAYTYVNENEADPNSPVIGIKLGGDMARDGSRYLQPGERDFFAFFADAQFPAATTSTTPSTTSTRP